MVGNGTRISMIEDTVLDIVSACGGQNSARGLMKKISFPEIKYS